MCSKTRGRCALIGPPYGCLSPAPPEDPPPKLDNETEREEKGEKKQIRESSEREKLTGYRRRGVPSALASRCALCLP